MFGLMLRALRISAWAKMLGDVYEDALTLWFVCRNPQAPQWIKVAAAMLVVYFISPLDLIPEILGIFGILDDLLLVPLGVRFLLRRVPQPVLEEARFKALRIRARLSR